MDDPEKGFGLLFGDGMGRGQYRYFSHIFYFGDTSSFFIVRVAALIDLITFSSYSATAVLFSVVSFIGMWFLFLTFYKGFPSMDRGIAIAILFLPSVIFWGSGILKDTLCLAFSGVFVWSVDQILRKSRVGWSLLLLLISSWIIFSIKKFILMALVPATIIWVSMFLLRGLQSKMTRVIVFPLTIVLIILSGYWATIMISEDDRQYSLDNIAKTAQVTAYDIRYGWGARFGDGSGYDIGELDGTWQSMLRLAPQAINVSLFRPYLWEVKNPLMLLSAIESTLLLLITLYLIFMGLKNGFGGFFDPRIIFSLTFSIVFAFAVGVSTYNFGTLSRYKISMLPFYAVSLCILYYSNRDRKLDALEAME